MQRVTTACTTLALFTADFRIHPSIYTLHLVLTCLYMHFNFRTITDTPFHLHRRHWSRPDPSGSSDCIEACPQMCTEVHLYFSSDHSGINILKPGVNRAKVYVFAMAFKWSPTG